MSRSQSPDKLLKYMALLSLAALCLWVAGCKTGPDPRYGGPVGQGRLVYEPGRGIVREGSTVVASEQALFDAVEKASNEKRWADCIFLSEELSRTFPEGSRVVEAIHLRIEARLELGRAREGGMPRGLPLDRLMFVYLAPDDDIRLRELMAKDKSVAEYASKLRSIDFVEFIGKLAVDADELSFSGQLAGALADCSILVTYYLPAQDLREFRQRTAELSRDVAWLAFAAREYNQTVEITEDLLAMNPHPAVKGDALFIRGHALRLNTAHAFAADTFDRLFRTSGLRDTDTRWRAHALLWQINEIMASSKGPLYDLIPYERALELLGEYELYRFENPGISPKLREQFVILCERAYEVLIMRDRNAADTYSRLGENEARDQYLANAANWEVERDKRLKRLQAGP